MSIAVELWVRGANDTVEDVFLQVARNFTLRLAEKLAQYICSLTRRAEALATPETECLLYATYWFRPILSELIGAATESADVNRERAPSGPVKVVVTNRPHSRRHNGIELVSGVSAVLAWFPASWASKIAPCHVSSVRKVAPYKCHRKLLLSVLTVRSKACKEMLVTKYCKQSNSRTRMPLG